jgi:multidrug resistance efflux pump
MTTQRRTIITTSAIALVIACAAASIIYWKTNYHQVYIDKANIVAPSISLAPHTAGTLEAVYVHEGDEVAANMPVARVGTELITSTIAGLITNVPNTIGAQVPAGQAVVTMIDPTQLRVVGQLDEDKGLSAVAVGDAVTFTVDAFGSQKFVGVVDEVSPTSKSSDVVFNISDQRQVNQFDIKARFDISTYTNFKNGMSARMWITTQ